MTLSHHVTFALAALFALSLAGCENKDYKRCLDQVDGYLKKVAACQEKTDATEKEQCMSAAEVGKMTKEDCDKAFK